MSIPIIAGLLRSAPWTRDHPGSPLHEIYKKLSIEKEIGDTLYSPQDGLGCRTPGRKKAIRQGLSIPSS